MSVPSSISGKPVSCSTRCTGRLAFSSAAALPPVETSSKPCSHSPCAMKLAVLGLDRLERSQAMLAALASSLNSGKHICNTSVQLEQPCSHLCKLFNVCFVRD